MDFILKEESILYLIINFVMYSIQKKYLFVVNPLSKRANKKLNLILKKDKGLVYDIFYTKAECNRKELRELAESGNFTHIIAVGGDGTIHDVLNSTFGLDVTIGVFPLGSGNDFARMFNIPTKSAGLTKMLQNNKTEVIDCGKVNYEYFINYCSFGLDAEIVDKSFIYRGFLPNSLTYIPAVYHALLTHSPKKITINGREEIINLIAIHNGVFYGGGIPINYSAKLNDGILNVCKVTAMARLKFMLLFPLVFLRKHEIIKQVEFSKIETLELDCKEKILSTLDGEFYEFEYPVNIEIVPKSIRILVR